MLDIMLFFLVRTSAKPEMTIFNIYFVYKGPASSDFSPKRVIIGKACM